MSELHSREQGSGVQYASSGDGIYSCLIKMFKITELENTQI